MASNPRHLSNHYDGLRVDIASIRRFDDDTDDDAVEAFRVASEHDLREKTGYAVRIAIKQHRTFVEILDAYLRSDGVQRDMHALSGVEWLHQDGECLTLASALAVGLTAEAADGLRERIPSVRMCGDRIMGRSYRQISRFMELPMSPHFTVDFQPNTAWIFHSENGTNPHAMLVCLQEDGGVAIYHRRYTVIVD